MDGQHTSVLCVAGKPLTIGERFVPRLTLRKIYNATYFRDRNERYQHEIANHYRDYKLSPQFERRTLLRRHYQRKVFVRPQRRPTATYGSFDFVFADNNSAADGIIDPSGYRYGLPMHTQYFPSFAATYTPRGRRTLCEGEPPDEIYNNTVRRIRAAHSCEQLKALVQRQFPTNKIKSHQRKRKTQKRQKEGKKEKEEETYKTRNNHSYRTQSPSRVDLHTFLQLANDHYEQGLLANITYLQSISERNAERRLLQQQKQWKWQQQQQTSDIEQDHDHNSGITSAESSTSNEWYTRPHLQQQTKNPHRDETIVAHSKLANLLQRIGRKRVLHNVQHVQQQQQQHQKQDINDDDDQHSDWPIRVDITPASVTFNDTTCAATVVTTSMNDYVYVNSPQNKPQFEAINTNSINKNVLQQKPNTFHDIIDNFKQLELNDENIELSSLPKITLTDCSQQQQELQQVRQKSWDSRHNKSPAQRRITGFILKQTKFGFNQSLYIPNETNYHSEARPP